MMRNWGTGVWASGVWGTGVWSASYTIIASIGAYLASGVNAILLWLRRLVGLSAPVVVTGTDATFARDRVIVAEAGAVDLTGQSATLTYSGGAPPVRQTFMLMGVQRNR